MRKKELCVFNRGPSSADKTAMKSFLVVFVSGVVQFAIRL